MNRHPNQPLIRILLNQGNCLIAREFIGICHLNSDMDNTEVYLSDGTWGGGIEGSPVEMEDVPPKGIFFRANRQNVLNIDYVHSIAQGPGRDFVIHLKEPYSFKESIITSEKKKELVNMLMYRTLSGCPDDKKTGSDA